MKIRFLLWPIAACVGLQAGSSEAKVVVCMERDVDTPIVLRAQLVATKMFSGAGLKLEWHGYSSCPSGRVKPIMISLVKHSDEKFKPGALAFAQAFEGTVIRVFYDRVKSAVDANTVPILLAHVLVHEITHILEGTDQHSDTGVMKARWDKEDFLQMAKRPLPLTEEDVLKIHNGLAAKARLEPRGRPAHSAAKQLRSPHVRDHALLGRRSP